VACCETAGGVRKATARARARAKPTEPAANSFSIAAFLCANFIGANFALNKRARDKFAFSGNLTSSLLKVGKYSTPSGKCQPIIVICILGCWKILWGGLCVRLGARNELIVEMTTQAGEG